uniref:Integrase n=1 Tax=Pseudomonas aeruginosa TaxID=287 RepID=A0A5P9WCN3_PSEAI|nr:hypothetical protein pNK546KPC_0380 [Pseudomonas aeruginosa]QHU24332.1 hypothetical protein [Pseudomonas aeruginosa]
MLTEKGAYLRRLKPSSKPKEPNRRTVEQSTLQYTAWLETKVVDEESRHA